MAGVMKNVPGVSDVRIVESGGVEYSLLDKEGHRRFTRIMLFRVGGIGDDDYLFDMTDIKDDELAQSLFADFEIKCRIGVASFHNETGH